MKITEVQIKKVYNDPTKPIKAKVTVIIDNCLALNNIRVLEKTTGTITNKFIAFPSQKVVSVGSDNEPVTGFFDIYHPINSETRAMFESAIYKALDDKALSEAAAQN